MLLIAAATLVKIVVIFQQETYLEPWTHEYEKVAENILRGEGYRIERFHTDHRSLGAPLYFFINTGVYWIFGHSFLAMLLVQVFLGALLGYTIYRIADALFGPACGAVACGLTVFHPGLAFYTVRQIHGLLLHATLIALVCWAVLRAFDSPSRQRLWVAGLVTGLCILTRPTMTFFLPVAGLLMLYRYSAQWRELTPRIVVSLVLAGLVVLPWTVRNWQVHGRFVYITTDTGELLWRGNHSGATGAGITVKGVPSFWAMPRDFKAKVFALNEMGQKQFFEARALEFIRNNPRWFIHFTFRKMFYFWWFHPLAGHIYPEGYLQIYQGAYVFIFSMGLLGLFVGWRRYPEARWSVLLILLLFGVLSFSQSLFYVNIRHRWGVEALWMIFTALGVVFLWHKLVFAFKRLSGSQNRAR